MPSNLQRGIKNNKQELRESTKVLQLIITNDCNQSLHFPEHTTSYAIKCQKSIVGNYCKMILKLKKYLFDKTLPLCLSKQTKNVIVRCNLYSNKKGLWLMLQIINTHYILSISSNFSRNTCIYHICNTIFRKNLCFCVICSYVKFEQVFMTIQNFHSIFYNSGKSSYTYSQ